MCAKDDSKKWVFCKRELLKVREWNLKLLILFMVMRSFSLMGFYFVEIFGKMLTIF